MSPILFCFLAKKFENVSRLETYRIISISQVYKQNIQKKWYGFKEMYEWQNEWMKLVIHIYNVAIK